MFGRILNGQFFASFLWKSVNSLKTPISLLLEFFWCPRNPSISFHHYILPIFKRYLCKIRSFENLTIFRVALAQYVSRNRTKLNQVDNTVFAKHSLGWCRGDGFSAFCEGRSAFGYRSEMLLLADVENLCEGFSANFCQARASWHGPVGTFWERWKPTRRVDRQSASKLGEFGAKKMRSRDQKIFEKNRE